MKILAYMSTKNRYDTTLPLAIQSIIMQTVKPNKFILYDDNDNPIDLREIPKYQYLFKMMDEKKIDWEVIFGERKGQHFNHQKANKTDFDWCWRLDDDCVADPDVLGKLLLVASSQENVGAVGGSILTPPVNEIKGSNKIDELYKPNKQWGYLTKVEEVDHLHCSFLYRPNIVNYDLELSPVAHREETMFTYGLHLQGYRVMLTPCVTWHLKSDGGIRSHDNAWFYEHDEQIFREKMKQWGYFSAVLNNGIGDHLAFKNLLPAIKKTYKHIILATCYPDVFKGEPIKQISVAEAESMGSIESYDIYKFMSDNHWKEHIIKAYEKMYNLSV